MKILCSVSLFICIKQSSYCSHLSADSRQISAKENTLKGVLSVPVFKKKKHFLVEKLHAGCKHGSSRADPTTGFTAVPDSNESLMTFTIKDSRLQMQKEKLPSCKGISLK